MPHLFIFPSDLFAHILDIFKGICYCDLFFNHSYFVSNNYLINIDQIFKISNLGVPIVVQWERI